MGIALRAASTLAVRLLAAPPGEPIVVLGDLELRFDRAAFVASIDALIAEAVESHSAASPRPPATRAGTPSRPREAKETTTGRPRSRSAPSSLSSIVLTRHDLAHVLRGRSLLTLDEVELDWLTLGERLEPVARMEL